MSFSKNQTQSDGGYNGILSFFLLADSTIFSRLLGIFRWNCRLNSNEFIIILPRYYFNRINKNVLKTLHADLGHFRTLGTRNSRNRPKLISSRCGMYNNRCIGRTLKLWKKKNTWSITDAIVKMGQRIKNSLVYY